MSWSALELAALDLIWQVAFAVITWCPKATVQAALAGVALDYVTLNPLAVAPDWTGGAQPPGMSNEAFLNLVRANSSDFRSAEANAQRARRGRYEPRRPFVPS